LPSNYPMHNRYPSSLDEALLISQVPLPEFVSAVLYVELIEVADFGSGRRALIRMRAPCLSSSGVGHRQAWHCNAVGRSPSAQAHARCASNAAALLAYQRAALRPKAKSSPSLPGNLVSCGDCCWQLCVWLVTLGWRAAAQAPKPGAECEGACAAAAARPRERRRGEGDRPAGLERQGSRSKDNPLGGEPVQSARTAQAPLALYRQ